MTKIWIWDIDATVADNAHRVPHLYPKEERDWDSFFAAQLRDTPILPMVNLMRLVDSDPYSRIVLITGRDARFEDETIAWLSAHDIPYNDLIMRPEGDRECDSTLKVRLIEENFSYRDRACIQTIFEDRKRVVEGLRAAGYHVCHVAEGDF